MNKKITADAAAFTFDSSQHEEFREFIRDVDADSDWNKVPLAEIEFSPLSKFTADDLYVGDEETYADSAFSELPIAMILPDDKVVCVRPYLWKQVKQLSRCTAPIMNDMANKNGYSAACAVLNLARDYLDTKSDALVLIRGGKVSGYASMYNANWTQDQQLSYVEKKYAELFPRCEFRTGRFTHEMTVAEYKLDSSICDAEIADETVMAAYAKAWKDAGMESDLNAAVPFIRFSTGESGLAAITVRPLIAYGKGRELPLSPALSVTHRGTDENVWEKFTDFPKETMTMFQNGLRALEKLCEMQVFFPYSCMTHVLKTFVGLLPITEIDNTAESFRVFFDPDDADATCKAIDIFNAVNELVNDCMSKLTDIRRLQAQELVARMLACDWSKLDVKRPIRLRSCRGVADDALLADD